MGLILLVVEERSNKCFVNGFIGVDRVFITEIFEVHMIVETITCIAESKIIS